MLVFVQLLTPNKMVQINNQGKTANDVISWLEYDPSTNIVIDTNEFGEHSDLATYAFIAGYTGTIIGAVWRQSIIVSKNEKICKLDKNGKEINPPTPPGCIPKPNWLDIILDFVSNFVVPAGGGNWVVKSEAGSIIVELVGPAFGTALAAGFLGLALGSALAIAINDIMSTVDPPLPPFLIAWDVDPLIGTPNLQIIPDNFFTLPLDLAQFASLYRLYIKNTDSTAKTYRIAFPNQPAGFTVKSSLPEVTIPAGETGVVGILLIPNAGLPAPGTQVPFQVTITDTATGQTQTTPTTTFTTPNVVGITLEGAPTQTATIPGGTVNATLTVKSTGNVAAANIPLTLQTSTGLSVSGLPATVSLGLGETRTFPLTLTASSGSLNDTLTATLTATFGQDLDGNPYKANAVIAVSVRSAETLPIERAAQTAASAQNAQLAQNLASLAEVTAQLQQKPGDAPLCGRLTLLYDQLLQLADVNPGLTSLKPQIQALRNLAATCNTPQLLTDSAQFFTNFTLPVVSATPAVSLVPTSVTLEPGEGTTFTLRLENQGTQPATFNLSLDTLPAGVTATLNRSSVTLGAGEVLDASSPNPVTLTLSQTPTTAQTFTVRVLAALAGTSVTLTASGLVRIAPAQADVVSVTADPVVIDQTQTTTTVTARILNAANLTRSALARLQVLDSTGTVLQTLPSVAVNLVPSTETLPVSLGTVGITGLNEGIYRLRASLLTPTNEPIPGRSAETLLFVGMPISATVRAEPALVAPGIRR